MSQERLSPESATGKVLGPTTGLEVGVNLALPVSYLPVENLSGMFSPYRTIEERC